MAGSNKNKNGPNKLHAPVKPKVQSSVHAVNNKKTTAQNQPDPKSNAAGLSNMQQKYGNRAAQQAVQRKGGQTAYKLDGQTSKQISREKGGGHQIEGVVQQKLSKSLGYDLKDVRVHTSKEADGLNRKVNAKAFTVGKDIFFRSREYNPSSRAGQELLAHELTHVVDQSKGKVNSSGGGMTVHAPNDVHERRADEVASQVVSGLESPSAAKQAAYVPGKGIENKNLQRASEEEVEMKSLQREGEEEVEMKSLQREGEEEVEMKSLQREGEEEVEMKSLQREGEEEVEMKSLQREGEEEVEMKSLQREGGEEEVEMKAKKS